MPTYSCLPNKCPAYNMCNHCTLPSLSSFAKIAKIKKNCVACKFLFVVEGQGEGGVSYWTPQKIQGLQTTENENENDLNYLRCYTFMNYNVFQSILSLANLYFPLWQAGKELSEKKGQEFEQLLSTIESYIKYVYQIMPLVVKPF